MSRRVVAAALVFTLALGHPLSAAAQVVSASAGSAAARPVTLVPALTLAASPLVAGPSTLPPLSAAGVPLPSVPSLPAAVPAAVPVAPVPAARGLKAFVASAMLAFSGVKTSPRGAADPVHEAPHARLVRETVAEWETTRSAESGAVAAAPSRVTGAPLARSASAPETRASSVPAPAPRSPRGLPKTSRALFWGGALLVAAVAVTGVPGLFVPSLMSGWLTWAGLGAMTISRWVRPAGDAALPVAAVKPAGWLEGLRGVWTKAKSDAAAQTALEARVGGFSWSAFRDWLIGGVRTGLSHVPLSLGLMLGAAAAAFPVASWLGSGVQHAEALAFDSALQPLATHFGGYLGAAMAQQALTVGVFAGVRVLAARLGAGKASGWIGGAAAMGVAAAIALSYTTIPMVVLPTLAIEAGMLFAYSRSGSWLAPLAGRLALSLFSLESARASLWIATMPAGALVGLPAVWMGVTVAALLAGALWVSARRSGTTMRGALRAQLDRLSSVGAWWTTPAADGRPKSFLPLLAVGALWGVVTFASMDLLATAISFIAPTTEGAPEVLRKMLTGPLDLVLYNFILVGFLEEFVFRRNVYRPIAKALEKLKSWGLTPQRVFWIAAVASSLIFSAAHYIDPTPLLAKFGMADAGSVAMTYEWSWIGFFGRAIGGLVLAWQYARSGTLLVPIIAHFASNTMEGLGYRWGAPGFLAMVVATLVLQSLVRTPKKPSGKAA